MSNYDSIRWHVLEASSHFVVVLILKFLWRHLLRVLVVVQRMSYMSVDPWTPFSFEVNTYSHSNNRGSGTGSWKMNAVTFLKEMHTVLDSITCWDSQPRGHRWLTVTRKAVVRPLSAFARRTLQAFGQVQRFHSIARGGHSTRSIAGVEYLVNRVKLWCGGKDFSNCEVLWLNEKFVSAE